MSKRAILIIASLILITAVTVSLRRPVTAKSPTHCVRVYLKLSDATWGTPAERDRFMAFNEQLEDRYASKQPFEYDGHEIGEGYFRMYFYGPSADTIISTIRPVLSGFGVPAGSYLIRRYGEVGSPEERLAL